ncbi:MAG: hypothetical protein AAB433_12270 [Nitrospirota bacterium]
MKYKDGQDVRLGDRVTLGKDEEGVVVCSIETGEYSSDYPEAQWGYLKKGIMINFPLYGLIHYEEPEADLHLIARAQSKE